MKLYDYPFSPNCRKVRAVAYELGIEFEHVPVNLLKGESHTASFLSLNPNGRVPVLQDGDFILWESNAIVSYLATKHGGAAGLVPHDARGRAEVDRWLLWQIAHLAPATSKVGFERIVKKLKGQGPPDEAAIKQGIADFEVVSQVLDGSLRGKEYVAGPLSVADFAIAATYSIAPACGLDVGPYRNIGSWLERILSRASMKRALADAQIM
jgi:glutathione S-transferase